MPLVSVRRFYLLLLLLLIAAIGLLSWPSAPSSAAPPSKKQAAPVTISQTYSDSGVLSYTYEQTPQRVIVTHPSAVELLLDLGLEKSILAAVRPSDAPLPYLTEQYEKLPRFKGRYLPSREEVFSLQPDMLIGWAHHFSPTALGDAAFWLTRHVGVYVVPSTFYQENPTFEETVYPFISDMGKIFQVEWKAKKLIADSRDHLTRLHSQYPVPTSRPKVIILQNHSSGTFSLYSNRTLLSYAASEAGAINICPAGESFVSAEKILAYDPDFIIFIPANNDPQQELTAEQAMAQLTNIEVLRSLNSIRQKRVIPISFATGNDGALRILRVVDQIAAGLFSNKCID